MKAIEQQLLPFLNGKKQLIIPIYQRTYSWQREQCEQMWNDIIRVGMDENLPGHFLGSVVYIQHGIFQVANIPKLLLIDGQQRLTTIMLLLIALAESAKNRTEETEISWDDLYDSYLINKHGKGEQRYKLLLTENDNELLKSIVDHPEKVAGLQTPNRLKENFVFFQEKLREQENNLEIVFQGISKLIIVDIALEKGHDNPQLIFESLNSTGMDLSQADLIRNYVLMGLDNEEQTRLYKEYWHPIEQRFRYEGMGDQFDRFMRDYLTLKQGVIPNIDKVYITFKRYHQSRYQAPIEEVVADIARYAEYFANMAFLKEEDQEIKQAMRDVNTLKVDVAYPFLLEVYHDYKQGVVSKHNLIEIMKLIESYVFRRAICGVPTNGLNKVFATLHKEIDKTYYLESIQATLLVKTGGGRFPRDDEFRAAFIAKDVYNYPRRNYLLRKIENQKRKSERVIVEDWTIEHIMPQSARLSEAWREELGADWKDVHERYLHTIGNLTLTGYNAELSNRPFKEKCTMEGGFNHSPLYLNASVAYVERWNQQAIEQRAQKLCDEAIEVWAIPEYSSEQMGANGKGLAKQEIEITGPRHHERIGFVPEGFRVTQISEKRFYLFRKMDGEWVQYGTGKNPWYAISWDYARAKLAWYVKKDLLPLGVSGVSRNYIIQEETNERQQYTLEDHPFLQGDVLMLFEELRKRLLNLSVDVREEVKKHYVAYKLMTNFVDVEPQKRALYVVLNMPFEQIDDPRGLCENVSNVGHKGNGEVRIKVDNPDYLADVMYLVLQAFDRQRDEVMV